MPVIQGEVPISVEDLRKAAEQSQSGQAPTVRVAVQVSSGELWHALREALTENPSEIAAFKQAISQNPDEADQLIAQLLQWQAQLKAPALSSTEAELLLRINQPIPAGLQQRYDILLSKRQEESLLPDEYDELLKLTEQIETLEAKRVATLGDLARLRNTSLRALITSLGLQPLSHG
jgi:hypothetical protein